MAPGSSGLGNDTVGKAGSGWAWLGTGSGTAYPAASKARATVSDPTPCSAVWTTTRSRGVSGDDDADDVVEVALEHGLVERLPAVVGQGHVGDPLDAGDLGGDLDVGGRDDLGAVAEVDLVAVVLGRVVAGGDHDAGVGAEEADRVREDGRRQRPRQHGGDAHRRRRRPRRCRGRRRRS